MLKIKKGHKPDFKFQKAVKKPIPIECYQINEPFEVHTMEGIMKGKAGDWLVVGVSGEMYAIDKEIFDKTYDLVF